MKPLMNRVSWIAIGVVMGVAPNSALAADQDASASASAHQVAEVVVTAQKREQRVQDVPLSVSAITGKDIVSRGATNLEDMQYAVPGLSAVEYGPGLEYIQIRGISNSLGSPTVGIYLDEMPVTGTEQQTTIDIRLLDMQRAEVLRGPQGTLYGEGSMGGTIRYITASPDLSHVSGSVEGEVNSVADGAIGYKANAVLNLPLVKDVVGIRLLVADEKQGGWIDSSVTGQKDVNGAEIKTFRGKLLVEPNANTKLSLLALHQESDQDYQNFARGGVTASVVPTFNHSRYDMYNGVLEQALPFGNLVESLGYLDSETRTQDDLTPFYLPLLEAPAPFGFDLPPGFITQIPLGSDVKSRIFTDETRLSSKGGTPFNWTVGFYYRDGDTRTDAASSTSPGTLPFALVSDKVDLKSRAWAVFGEASYQLTPQLNALVGLRYYDDKRDQVSDSVSLGFPAHDLNSGSFHTLNPRFNIRYEFSPTSMVYVNVAKGFRSGGFNLTSAGAGVFKIPPSYQPDTLWSYELGAKQQLADRRLEFQGAVYYEDWKNVQSYAFAPGSPIIVVENSGHVTGWGVDLMGAWHASPNLDLSATYGWNDLAFRGNLALDKVNGDPVDFAVHDSASASLDFHHRIGNDTAFLRIDYQYAGKGQISLRNFGGQVIHLPSRSAVNARLGLDIGHYEVALFGTNLNNDRAPIIPGPFGVISDNVEQRPRTIGVNVKAHF